MRFNTKSISAAVAGFMLLLLGATTTAVAAGWNIPGTNGGFSDYKETSPDIHPDGWLVSSMAEFEGLEIQLRSSDGALLRWLDAEQVRNLHKVHLEIQEVAETRAALYITRGDQPNASAGQRAGYNTVFVNFAMFDLIDGDLDLWAALLGHELAHLKLNHGEKQAKKNAPLNVLKTVGSAVLNNPLANIASSTLLDSVSAKFSRDDERQADYMGVIWSVEANHDPNGAVELHRRLAERNNGHPLPFLSTHPSSPERMEKLAEVADRLGKSSAE